LTLGNSFIQGGYFKQEIYPGKLSVISLNSMYFYNGNKDLSTKLDDCDVAGSPGQVEMVWFQQQLAASQAAGERVYVMHHVPPLTLSGTFSTAAVLGFMWSLVLIVLLFVRTLKQAQPTTFPPAKLSTSTSSGKMPTLLSDISPDTLTVRACSNLLVLSFVR
jgi:hypothetical protein